MDICNIDEIKKVVNSLAQVIHVPEDYLPTFGYSRDFAFPHIEVDHHKYHYVVVERGEVLERKVTGDLQELLYWIFEHATFEMAVGHELKNRIEDKDPRRMLFHKQEELLARLNPNWSATKKAEHAKILKNHPYDDLAGLRSALCRELRSKGISEEEIHQIAYEKFPE